MDGIDATRNGYFGGLEDGVGRWGELGPDPKRPVVVLQFHDRDIVPPDRLRPSMGGELPRRIEQTSQHHPEDHRGGIVGRGFPLRRCGNRFRKPEFLPQQCEDRDGAEGQRRSGHQFLGLEQHYIPGYMESCGSDVPDK